MWGMIRDMRRIIIRYITMWNHMTCAIHAYVIIYVHIYSYIIMHMAVTNQVIHKINQDSTARKWTNKAIRSYTT